MFISRPCMKLNKVLYSSLLITLSAATYATPILTTGYNVMVGNGTENRSTAISLRSVPNGIESGSGMITYRGMDGEGAAESMTINYDTQAEATLTELKTYASASIDNPIYNPANTPAVTGNFPDISYNPDGTPSTFFISSSVLFADTFTIEGNSALASVQLSLNVHGQTFGSSANALATASVIQHFPDTFSTLYDPGYSAGFREFNSTVYTRPISIVESHFDLRLALHSFLSFNLREPLPLDNFISGFSDFSNTISFGSFTGFDVLGNAVALARVTGSSGRQYAISAESSGPAKVPEPATLLLLVFCLASIFLNNRIAHKGHPPRFA